MNQLHPTAIVFFGVLVGTIVIWTLRGLAILAFLPSSVLWVLLLLSIGTGVVAILESTR